MKRAPSRHNFSAKLQETLEQCPAQARIGQCTCGVWARYSDFRIGLLDHAFPPEWAVTSV